MSNKAATGRTFLEFKCSEPASAIRKERVKCIETKFQTRKQTNTLSMSLYKAVMYLEFSPFLDKEREGGGANSTDVSVCCLFILPLLAEKCPFVTMHHNIFSTRRVAFMSTFASLVQ